MHHATASLTNAELAERVDRFLCQIKQNQLQLSEVSAKLIHDKSLAGTSDSEIHTLLSHMIDEATRHHMAVSEVPELLTRFIELTSTSGISNSELESALTRIMNSTKSIPFTAAEVSALWHQYLSDSMAIYVYKYFLNIIEDEQIQSILESALQFAESHIKKITGFLNANDFEIPLGFTEKDVNLTAPRLFSDRFMLYYSNVMTIHGLTAYSLAFTNSARRDIQDHFFNCIAESKELFQKIDDLAKHQPEFSSVPSVPSPHGIEFVDSTGFLSNLVGDKRPLNASEITNLFFNSKKTGFVRSLSLAFSQVAESEEVRKFMLKNVKLAGKDAESLNAILQQDNLPTPRSWDSDITDSTVGPFSDKLMMFHAALLVNAALSYYGAALGSSLRSDIILNYKGVFNHAMQAGALCYNILVNHGWMEKQPEAIDRTSLVQGAKA
ncbi:DUF3231 family protein [Paenibacillus chartarius]|uniref:DUF3231 family protein n=1 Tax=Paenibacillus chartarius TaxID=747481 RepID=A0ABV6DRA9_9BACL